MPGRIPRKCADGRCPKIGVFNGPYCDEHRRLHERQRQSQHPAQSDRATWERFRQYLISCGNVVCQRVQPDGMRCRRPVWGFHHIIEAAARPDIMYEWQNVVGVCHECHPRPNDEDQGEYVPTMWRSPMSDEPPTEIAVMPGQSARGVSLWTLANRLETFSRALV